jgi:hypothetical protein
MLFWRLTYSFQHKINFFNKLFQKSVKSGADQLKSFLQFCKEKVK